MGGGAARDKSNVWFREAALKILVYEPSPGGHRFQYVAVLIQALGGADREIVLATSKGARVSAQYKAHLRSLEHAFHCDDSIRLGSSSVVSYWLKAFLAFRRAVRKHRPDLIYVPFGDGLSQIMGVARLLGVRVSEHKSKMHVLLFRGVVPGDAEGAMGALKSVIWQWITAMAGVTRYHLINPIQLEAIGKYGLQKLADRVCLIPEPVEHMDAIDSTEARRRLGIPVGGRYVACLGALDGRKGVDLLIRAFGQAGLNRDDRLLLLGGASEEIRLLLEKDFGDLVDDQRIVVIDRYVSQEELEAGLFAADLICTPYPNHLTSSGFVVRAAAAGKPVLASDVGWMGQMVPRYELGMVCNVKDISKFSFAIENALECAESFVCSARAQAFSGYHSIDNTIAHWRATLPEDMGHGSETMMVKWESVQAVPPAWKVPGIVQDAPNRAAVVGDGS